MEVIAFLCLLVVFALVTIVVVNDEVDDLFARVTMFLLVAIPTVYYGWALFQ